MASTSTRYVDYTHYSLCITELDTLRTKLFDNNKEFNEKVDPKEVEKIIQTIEQCIGYFKMEVNFQVNRIRSFSEKEPVSIFDKRSKSESALEKMKWKTQNGELAKSLNEVREKLRGKNSEKERLEEQLKESNDLLIRATKTIKKLNDELEKISLKEENDFDEIFKIEEDM